MWVPLLDSGLTDTPYVDWEVFSLLEALGHLYTYGDSYDSADARPAGASFDDLDLMDVQRVALARRLVERHPLISRCERQNIVRFSEELAYLDSRKHSSSVLGSWRIVV